MIIQTIARKLPRLRTVHCAFLLLGFVAAATAAAFLCFLAGPPLAYVGAAIIIISNIEFIGTMLDWARRKDE